MSLIWFFYLWRKLSPLCICRMTCYSWSWRKIRCQWFSLFNCQTTSNVSKLAPHILLLWSAVFSPERKTYIKQFLWIVAFSLNGGDIITLHCHHCSSLGKRYHILWLFGNNLNKKHNINMNERLKSAKEISCLGFPMSVTVEDTD